jgi:hypothetical protein
MMTMMISKLILQVEILLHMSSPFVVADRSLRTSEVFCGDKCVGLTGLSCGRAVASAPYQRLVVAALLSFSDLAHVAV